MVFSRQYRYSIGGATPFITAAAAAAAAWLAATRRQRVKVARLHRVLVDLLLNTLTTGDPETARHSRRVADLVDRMLVRIRLDRRDHATIRVAALLHDMGKVEDELFHLIHSPDPLTKAERTQVKEHPHTSAGILQPLEPFHPGLTEIVRGHHECWNGRGYPDRLAGDQIPLGARIIAVADAFDALTQPRSYRDPLDPQQAMEVVREAAGTRFDPNIVALMRDPSIRERWIHVAHRGRAEEEAARTRSGAEHRAPVR